MASVFARRADEFDALVEGTSTDGSGRAHARAARASSAAAGCARPGSAAGVRGRPARAADGRGRDRPGAGTARRRGDRARLTRAPAPPGRTSRDRRLAAASAGLALLGAAASVAVGAQVALPGDTLYPIKRAIEDAQHRASPSASRETGRLMMLAAPPSGSRRPRASTRARRRCDVRATADTLRRLHRPGRATAARPDDRRLRRHRRPRPSIASCATSPATAWTGSTASSRRCPPTARDELVAAADAVVAIDADARHLPDLRRAGVGRTSRSA